MNAATLGPLMALLSCRHAPPAAPAAEPALEGLAPGDRVAGFQVEALYTDHADRVRGARLVHQHTGFVLKLFGQDTVPQAYVWVNTVPDDDRGAPHTQEHLLLGKGNQGRRVASAEAFHLVDSSAFTEPFRTVYHFRTVAGPDAFFDTLSMRLDALLHPDYSDVEIAREVYHFGVKEDPATGRLTLEEKGTVYNEMDATFRSAGYALWTRIERDLFGEDHPAARVAGGDPDAMRSLGPADIRRFHAANYALGNMGAIVFLPERVALDPALRRFDGILRALQPEPTPPDRAFRTVDTLPPFAPATDRSRRQIAYPAREGTGLASIQAVWPARAHLRLREDLLFRLFADAVVNDRDAFAYRAIVDGETRERHTGAQSVTAFLHDRGPGTAAMVAVGGFPADAPAEDLDWALQRVRTELREIAGLPAGHDKLAEIARRIRIDLVAWRREARMALVEPPEFGTRGTGSAWFDLLRDLDREGGDRRSIAREDDFRWIEAQLAAPENVWAGHLAAWGLTAGEPVVYVTRPDPALLERYAAEREARIAAEIERLRAAHPSGDPQQALAAYRERLDAETAALEAARQDAALALASDPPMDWDEHLDTVEASIGGVPAVVNRFPAMSGARIALALDLHAVPEALAPLVPHLPALLTQVGVIVDGVPLDHDEVADRLREETRYAWVALARNDPTGRAELVLQAEGTDRAETERGLAWIARFLHAPDWRADNLPRLRFLAEQAADRALDETPADYAWSLRYQDDPLLLWTGSVVGRQLETVRLKWRLTDPGDPERRAAIEAAFARLGAGGEVDPGGDVLIAEAVRDVRRIEKDLPEATRDADRREVCALLAADLASPPDAVLAELRALVAALAHRDAARLVLTGGPALAELDGAVQELVDGLDPAPAGRRPWDGTGGARARIAARGGDGGARHLFWLDPARRSGSVWIEAPVLAPLATDEASVLTHLAGRVLGGGGADSIFMRTWGEGLAYGNGVRIDPIDGRIRYTATHCPDLAQTVAFAGGVVEQTEVRPALAAYAVAGVFDSVAWQDPQTRGFAAAGRRRDGLDPARVRAFRSAVLAQAARPDLVDQLRARVVEVHAAVLPTLGGLAPDALSVAMGDARQLEVWSQLLARTGHGAVERVYPRDFWLRAPPDDASASSGG